jgi:hypothetical protein
MTNYIIIDNLGQIHTVVHDLKLAKRYCVMHPGFSWKEVEDLTTESSPLDDILIPKEMAEENN